MIIGIAERSDRKRVNGSSGSQKKVTEKKQMDHWDRRKKLQKKSSEVIIGIADFKK